MLSDLIKKKHTQNKLKYFVNKIKLLTFSNKIILRIKNNLILEFDNEHIATMLGTANINEPKSFTFLEIIISEH